MDTSKPVGADKTLDELLKVNSVKHIATEEELLDYFNIDNRSSEGYPEITAKKRTIIIFDNKDFNETYLIDLFNTIMEANKMLLNSDLAIKERQDECLAAGTSFDPALEVAFDFSDFQFAYCDDPVLRTKIFAPKSIHDIKEFVIAGREEEVKIWEKNGLTPSFMYITPGVEVIHLHIENYLCPISYEGMRYTLYESFFRS